MPGCQGSSAAEKQTWREFGVSDGEKLLMTTGGSADVWDGIPQHSHWLRASLRTCQCVLVILGADHLLAFKPGIARFLLLVYYIWNSGGASQLRLTHDSHSLTVVYCT